MKVRNLPLKIAGLLVFTGVCAVLFLFLFQQAGGHLGEGSTYNVNVVVPDAYNLVQNGDVREAGVTVGYITGITNQGPNGKVSLAIQSQYAPLYKDAQLEVRTKTLVGENYMSIEYPGSPQSGAVPKGGTLTLQNAIPAVDLNQILGEFDPRTRAMVTSDLRALGRGFAGRGGDVNEFFGSLGSLTSTATPVMQTLAAQRGQLADLVQYTGQTMQAFANRGAQLQQLISTAKTTALAVAARDQALSQAIDELPSMLTQARSTVTALGTLSSQATPVIDNLDTAARLLAGPVRQLTPTTTQARRLFAALPQLVKSVNPLVSRLRVFASSAKPQIPPLSRFLTEIIPAVAYLSAYNREFGAFFANQGSMNEYTDTVGHLARVSGVFGLSSIDEFNAADRKLLEALIAAGGLSDKVPNHTNSYPAPGTVGDPQPPGGYPQLQASPPGH
jgi:phospholipid/cholesterol/gamma-HCH transport system substrate-binding protein